MAPNERGVLLHRLADEVEKRKAIIGQIEALDAGKIAAFAEGDVQNFVDTIKIKHVSGGWSNLGMKAYNQGRGSFEGTAQHVIWLDEEPPADVYGECLIRTATTNGVIMLTFTPLDGLSTVVLQFMPAEFRPGQD